MRVVTAVAGLLVIALLAACGGSSDSSPKTVTEKVTTVVKEAAPSSSSSDAGSASDSGSSGSSSSSGSSNDGGGSVDVPDETGQRLDVAEDDLRSNNLRYKELGGGAFGIIVKSNWTVCKQDPSSGTSVPEDTRVRLIVDRQC